MESRGILLRLSSSSVILDRNNIRKIKFKKIKNSIKIFFYLINDWPEIVTTHFRQRFTVTIIKLLFCFECNMQAETFKVDIRFEKT